MRAKVEALFNLPSVEYANSRDFIMSRAATSAGGKCTRGHWPVVAIRT